MKNNIIILILISAACTLVTTACNDMLNISEHGVLNYETFYKTDDQIASAEASLYIQVKGNEFNYFLTKNMLSDDFWAGGSQRGDNIDLEAINEYRFDAEEDYIEGLFTSYYTQIYKANVILDHVDEKGDSKAQEARAEAKVFRAWSYFELISMWGNPPIVDHELLPSEYSRPNGSTEALWALVEKDLTEAISSGALQEKSGLNDNTSWHVTKQFAEALLGKTYLWQKKYSEAASMFTDIVKSKLYKLYQGDYGDMHLASNKHYCESMFESNRIYDSNNAFDNFTLYYLMINWRMDHMSYPTDTPIMNTGWGFCTPQKGLYEDFVKDEGADGYRLNQTMLTYAQMKSKMNISINAGSEICGEGYFMWKWRTLSSERGYSSDYVYNANILWMRYAEVLLCGAEASLQAGDETTALDYINRIRVRAKLAKLTTVTLDDIKLEKRLELCGEGTRFQDLVRWGDAASTLSDQGETSPFLESNGEVIYRKYNSSYGFKTGKNELLPYPATEMRLNSNITQNPGY
jgi:hypothetical protein